MRKYHNLLDNIVFNLYIGPERGAYDMLIQFSVSNFRSFKDKATLNMVASPKNELADTNIINVSNKLRLTRTAAIYGSNASGKSNLIKAMSFMKYFVATSSKEKQAAEPIPVDRFRLSTEQDNAPSFFEIIFIVNGITYRYGFEVNQSIVVSEWLFSIPTIKEARLFTREGQRIEVGNSFREGKGLEKKTRDNALFLSVVAQWNGETAVKLLTWFNNFSIISGLDDAFYRGLTIKKLDDSSFIQKAIKYLRVADIDIHSIGKTTRQVQEILPKNMPDDLRSLILKGGGEAISLWTQHRKYNDAKEFVGFERFDMDNQESEGTKKLFFMLGPLLDALSNNKILIVDEMDTRLHPQITQFIIDSFHTSSLNASQTQLIFATHDVHLMTKRFFRRDQIWFTQKDKYGSTHFYSLADYRISNKGVRNDASYINNYLQGRYGAIPYIDHIAYDKLINETLQNDKP